MKAPNNDVIHILWINFCSMPLRALKTVAIFMILYSVFPSAHHLRKQLENMALFDLVISFVE